MHSVEHCPGMDKALSSMSNTMGAWGIGGGVEEKEWGEVEGGIDPEYREVVISFS